MRRRIVFGSALAAAAALVACDGGPAAPDGVRLSTDRATYAAGEPLTVTVANDRATVVTYSRCVSTIERRDGGWRAVARYPQEITGQDLCNAGLGFIEPGAAATLRLVLPARLGPGLYRWRFRDLGDRATNPFEVR